MGRPQGISQSERMTTGPSKSTARSMSRPSHDGRSGRWRRSGAPRGLLHAEPPNSGSNINDGGSRRLSNDVGQPMNSTSHQYPVLGSTVRTAPINAAPISAQGVGHDSTGNNDVTFVPIAFQRFQNVATPFRLNSIPFPPPRMKSVPALWTWQMAESRWVPFDTQVSRLLESLWIELEKQREREQQDQHPETAVEASERIQGQEQERQRSSNVAQQQRRLELLRQRQQQQQHQQSSAEFPGGASVQVTDTRAPVGAAPPHPIPHKVYVYLPPWQYCIDLDKMLQQNISTHRVRPIRRTVETGALWFVRGENGCAER